jgi:K(+)-stimulated pyrophosphate-energized sodium pump
MLLPGCITIVTPILVGLIMGAEALGAYMAGVTVSGVVWAIFQNNAGGAWDNAKKSFEKGVEINGEMFYKKSEPHKAAVVGDTVGDPFKDTSGPSMNILIKLSCLVGLTLAPLLHEHSTIKAELTPSSISQPVNKVAENSGKNTDYSLNTGHSTIKH